MIGNVGLPGWFVATGLRVSLKQPNSRGIPGSFVAIFSDVNRLDVCPVGYYNRRMTFLRGTGRRHAVCCAVVLSDGRTFAACHFGGATQVLRVAELPSG